MVEELARVNVQIFGQVQGVFFRSSLLEQAQGLNLRGWVQNLPDGSVEFFAEGQRYALEALVAWARQGPPLAKVDDVITRWEAHVGDFDTFKIVR